MQGQKSFALLIATIAACIPPGYYGQQTYGQQPYGQQPAQQPQATSGLTCMQLFGCFQTCKDGPCIQTCLGQADANVQAAAGAAMRCSSEKCANGGGDCLAQQCSVEVATCTGTEPVANSTPVPQRQQPVREQMRPGQPHTTANILPWLVGDWIGTNHQFVFHADGRVRRSSGVALYTNKGTYGCVSLINDTGTVTQEGDLLIMKFSASEQNHCREKTAGVALTVRYQIDWRQPYGETAFSQLLLRDIDCTKGTMYCDDTMRRR